MWWRLVSAGMAAFAAWAAVMQLNDPDPARWTLLYASAAVVALCAALDKPLPRASALLTLVALGWATAIVPELVGRWQPADLATSMSGDRPEVEYGRELGGLVIVGSYAITAALRARTALRSRQAVLSSA